MEQYDLVNFFAQLKPSSTFLQIRDYLGATNEVAHFNLIFNFSYENALKKSIDLLNAKTVSTKLEKEAKKELLESYQKSLDNISNEDTTKSKEDGYVSFKDAEGNPIKGIKMNKETKDLYLYGLLTDKVILKKGSLKEKNSSEKTKIKEELKKDLPVNKFRQFKLSQDKFSSILIQKKEISGSELNF